MRKKIYALGHSTRTIEEFISLLKAHEIEMVIDIRHFPHSKHCPQFNQEALKESLKREKISYRHIQALGGRRKPRSDSVNFGWKNAAFRGFADYMQTPPFQKALERLEALATKKKCALVCAEGIYWRCHRSLILDALLLRKWKGYHIQSRKTASLHKKTPFMKMKKGLPFYPKYDEENGKN